MKKYVIILVSTSLFLFGHIHQKVAIIVAAYQIHNQQVILDNLVEEKHDLLYNFSREANLINLNKRLVKKGLDFNYPKQYVRVTKPKSIESLNEPARESIFAKIFSVGSIVEAQP